MEVKRTTRVDLQTQLNKLYRLSDRLDQVNWDARYNGDKSELVKLLPIMKKFMLDGIGKVIESETERRAVIGISGGLDSSVCAWLCATAMEEAAKNGDYGKLSLVLLAFKGINEEDLQYARRFSKEIIRIFPSIDIRYAERDLTRLLHSINEANAAIIAEVERTNIQRGSLATRLISNMVLEFADKTGYCTIDPTNGTEVVLGEFVLGCGGELAPLSSLYKSQVYDLAEAIRVPRFIIDRRPINSTFGNDKVLSYFGKVPAELTAREAYGILDPALYLVYRKRYGPDRLARELGHSSEFSERICEIVKKQNHRRAIPYFKVLDHIYHIRRTATEISNDELKDWVERSFCFDYVRKLKRD